MFNKKDSQVERIAYDLIIIGSGAAGLSAGIYAGRYLMKVLIFGKEFGGETAKAGPIANYPGFKSVDGYELMERMKEQAEALGAKVIDEEVTSIQKEDHCFNIIAGNTTYHANAVIFAVGTERRRLGLANENELTSRGVHYCVTCDGPVFKDKTVAMAGGGDSSVKGVNLLSDYVKKVYLIVRGKEVVAEAINFEQMRQLGNKTETLLETEVKELVGKNRLEKIILSKPYKGSDELIIDGLFVEIGALPNVELAVSLGVQLDKRGYIETDAMMKTNIDGIFAAGDTVNLFGSFKQDITAAAMGAVAATSAYQYRKVHGELCIIHARPEKSQH